MEELDVNQAFWRGRRVLLTGHTGFKGSWLSLWLQLLGAKVTGYALEPPTTPNLFEVARVGRAMTSIVADIRDLDRLKREASIARPEIVIHMAAQPLVRRSFDDASETYSINVMGTVNVLEAVRQTRTVRAVLNVTSDKCYQARAQPSGYSERDPVGGDDPYSSSKACSELITAAYRSSFFDPAAYSDHGVALASARAGNVIGGGDWARDRLIPDVFRAVQARAPMRVRNPSAIRPWQHVLEPLLGYLMLSERLFEEGARWGQAWNFGPAPMDHQPVSAVVRQISECWGERVEWTADHGPNPPEAAELRLNCEKARVELGWRPKWDLRGAIDAVVEWYRAHRRGEDMRQISSAQIESYMA